MAIYHNSIRILSASHGRSAIQFSAYMNGEKDINERTGEVYDHTSKEEVTYTNMLFADNVPEELRDRHKFWSEVEKYELSKNSNAQLSRTFEIALPKEYWSAANEDIADKFCKSLLEDGHPAVQYAIHTKDGNPHLHIMVPIRKMDEKGNWESKETKGYIYRNSQGKEKILSAAEGNKLDPNEWQRVPVLDKDGKQKTDSRNRLQWKKAYIEKNEFNTKEKLKEWRDRWEDILNKDIEFYNKEFDWDDTYEKINTVSAKSHKDRGLELIPTLHEGYAARKIEKEGGISEVCEKNRQIQEYNNSILEMGRFQNMIMELQQYIEKLKQELKKYLEEKVYGRYAAAERLRTALASSSRESRDTRERTVREGIDNRAARIRESRANRISRDVERQRQAVKDSRTTESREQRSQRRSSTTREELER